MNKKLILTLLTLICAVVIAVLYFHRDHMENGIVWVDNVDPPFSQWKDDLVIEVWKAEGGESIKTKWIDYKGMIQSLKWRCSLRPKNPGTPIAAAPTMGIKGLDTVIEGYIVDQSNGNGVYYIRNEKYIWSAKKE